MRLFWKSPLCLRVASFCRATHASAPNIKPRAARPWAVAAVVFSFSVGLAQAQFTNIVVFGDSLSDTGNFATLTYQKYGIPVPSPVGGDYTLGRFTDGIDTYPAAMKYDGVWVEQLAAMLPTKPAVTASLAGGTNFAYGLATTGGGSSTVGFGPGNFYTATINNIGQQITTYLATHPKINSKTLFVIWGGAIDVLHAGSPTDVIGAAVDQANNVNRLVNAGASRILVANLPPLGAIPELNTMPAAAAAANQGTTLFNDTLSAGLDVVQVFHFWNPPHLYRLNVPAVFKSVLTMPAMYGLTDVTDTSQFVLTANPDQYLFWDGLHPTTAGHHILALAALKMINSQACFALSGPWYTPSCEAVP